MRTPATSWEAEQPMPTSPWLSVTEHVPIDHPADAPMVVLVHGSLDRGASFARVRRRLDDLHTVVYDRRGYHRSRHVLPLNTTLDGHVDDLLAVIDGRAAVVVGHSYGGDIALGAALREPTAASIVAVVAYEPPMPWLEVWEPADGGAGSASPPRPDDPIDAEVAAAAAERFFRRIVGDAAWERLPESARLDRRADGPALEAELRAIRIEEAPFDVGALAIPAVFGLGGDSVGRYRQGATWLVDHTPGAELVELPGASHGAHLTHPDGFAQLVRRALARVGHSAASHP
jgi:pimeloyl-ACP methyl ester carboxylesterase